MSPWSSFLPGRFNTKVFQLIYLSQFLIFDSGYFDFSLDEHFDIYVLNVFGIFWKDIINLLCFVAAVYLISWQKREKIQTNPNKKPHNPTSAVV